MDDGDGLFDAPLSDRVEHSREIGELISDGDRRRFAAKVVRTEGCWLWTGAISSPDGYGRFSLSHGGRCVTVGAHRFALVAAGVELPGGAVAEHFCNEPLCVRVDSGHVFVSSQRANLAYAVASGRAAGSRVVVDSSRRLERSRRVRQLARDGFDIGRYRKILARFSSVNDTDPGQLALW
ncbi:hypothetical protein [Corynebacterium bovis]|uniref:hypothetical protein n=1 Tax=Corynebacterium bovis TaxID=36808 RepID=UPI0031393A73